MDTNVRSVPALELGRYLGLWFEIGRLPLRFEDDGSRDVTAEYSLNDDGTVRVDNRCLDEKGEPTQALGQGKPDEEHPGRLRVTFLPEALRWIPFTDADYWVLRIDEDYAHALVGTPDHKHLWLLARAPRISEDVEQAYLATAREQGFDLEKWIRPAQSGAVVQV
ncbi:lipocalin family protein [Microbacterium sp. NPDC058342]|uniref:lipocalin family protein n=1 Tax=Microbacterium sp. NPDC058342 TaxID=3346454 RepID=UPI0036619D76